VAAVQYTSTTGESTVKESTDEADNPSTLQISSEFRARCRLPDDIGAAPHFESDDSTLHAHGQGVLDAVAQCLTEGSLKDETITLIGRADPRGSEQHNQALGQNRAAAARDYLTRRGVPAERIHVVSRGEQGARGSDEATWAQDRRVDLELGDKTAGTPSTASASAASTKRQTSAGVSDPIRKGTLLQIRTSESRPEEHPNAMSYSDTAEGGRPKSTE
jgi:outer membrane protein OmpA-like peptidoglycan-associated protein